MAISVEPRVTDLTSADPDVPMLAVMTPVAMSMVAPCRVTVTFLGAPNCQTVSATRL